MKHADINLGHEYLARVSGELVRVKVMTQTVKLGYSRDGLASRPERRVFVCKNLKTGKQITRSAAALRPASQPNPNMATVKRLREQWEAARRTGQFDLCLALRELSRGLILEPNGGPMTRVARAALYREFPSHESVIGQ